MGKSKCLHEKTYGATPWFKGITKTKLMGNLLKTFYVLNPVSKMAAKIRVSRKYIGMPPYFFLVNGY